VHAEARTQVTETRKPCLCRWATSLGADSLHLKSIEGGYFSMYIKIDIRSMGGARTKN